jgi:pyruvate dehydrogenase E2 component (dihydrolipoamide acetyltransferase)
MIFKLPDLGEGLAEAEIREWLVRPGDRVQADQPLLTVETDKAVIEVPSPKEGVVKRLYAEEGDIVPTGAPLVAFEGDEAETPREDAGTVVGEVRRGQGVLREGPTASISGRGATAIMATPAVRALARQKDIDLSIVTPTGPGGSITRTDVERAARVLAEAGPVEKLRGVRRAMAQAMTHAHAEVADVTVNDDADIHDWAGDSAGSGAEEGARAGSTNVTLRLIRAIAAGCKAVPALNAWYDAHVIGRRLLQRIDLGIAVETEEGLFVPVLRNVAERSPEDLREGLEALKRDVRNRSIPPEELRGHTFILSNYGRFGGKYTDPIVMPPAVAILGAGRAYNAVVAHEGRPAVRRHLPLSLTFDHRAATGAEASRCLMAIIEDLQQKT